MRYTKVFVTMCCAVVVQMSCMVLQLYATPTQTPGGLLQFTSRSEFQAAFPGLAREDFEESTVDDSARVAFGRPLDNTTNVAGAFVPGDIEEGVRITSTGTSVPGEELGVCGGGYLAWNNTSKAVYNNNWNNLFTVEFPSEDVYAVGMDLVFIMTTIGNAEIKIYLADDTLIDTLTYALGATPVFWGVYSDQPITKITIAKNPNDNWISIDNIQFGSTTSHLTYYTEQSTFESFHPELVKEDFEESVVGDSGTTPFSSPLNKETNAPGAFEPGDIEVGMHIRPITSSGIDDGYVAGKDYRVATNNLASKVVGFSGATRNIAIEFVGLNTYTVGMDVAVWFSPAELTVIIYNWDGKILGVKTVSAQTSETFWGVASREAIGQILILNNSSEQVVDNIQFGASFSGLQVFNHEADFVSANGQLAKEDFAGGGPVADNAHNDCDEPIDSNTDQTGCFAPGDILPDIVFQTEANLNPASPTYIYLFGLHGAPFNNTTPLLGTHGDSLEMVFTGKTVSTVGLSVVGAVSIALYGPGDAWLGTITNDPGATILDFWGVTSSKPIKRMVIFGYVGGAIIDYVMFGGAFPWSMYIPIFTGNGAIFSQ